ncbi:MAG: tetratricopeptide repeat protein [Bacteroidales bacterium]|nr:tetratricopeptide repeat protein [Bacteroidales bacterium]MBN2697834.1 tetratricopeptide repeat protein [Bacteroidales bacterium]
MINVSQINSRYVRIVSLAASRRVKDALDALNKLAAETAFNDFFIQSGHLERTYEQMLKYTLEGIEDPERDNVYNRLLVSILELTDRVRDFLLEKHSGWHTYILKREMQKQQMLTEKGIIETLDDLAFKTELDELLSEKKKAPKSSDLKRQKLVNDIFRHLWLNNEYNEVENSLARVVLKSKEFNWNERALIINAILLSGLRYWDQEKVMRLIDFAESGEQEVSARALVAIVIILYRYDSRIALYPEISGRLKILKDDLKLDKNLEKISIQMIRTRDTMELGKKLHEDIIPEVARLKPELEDKLKLEELMEEQEGEERNPDWESVFRESDGLYQKLDEFMKLQMEGADVYMTTFARLKQFGFFSELTNWLMPFYKENPDLAEIYETASDKFDPEIFIDGLIRTPFLCNSDKYSFIFNIKYLPDDQKQMLSTAFNMEMEGLDEFIADEKLSSGDFTFRTVIIQYIQDLYRFFKISQFKDEFEDIFSGKLDLYYAEFFNSLVSDLSIIRNIAEFFFEKAHYEEAFDIFTMLLKENPEDTELLEKTGYALQKMGEYRKAVSFYRKIELSGSPRLWVLKNMGLCYRKLDNYSEALNCYREASRLSPDEPGLGSIIGYCHMKLGNYKTALDQYFKLEYLNPGNQHILRPIAWCYFVLGELEKSDKYFRRVVQAKPDYYDYINYGHVLWALGKRKEAIEQYSQSLKDPGFGMNDFLKVMEDDKKFLIQNGVDRNDIPLLLDYLHYNSGK